MGTLLWALLKNNTPKHSTGTLPLALQRAGLMAHLGRSARFPHTQSHRHSTPHHHTHTPPRNTVSKRRIVVAALSMIDHASIKLPCASQVTTAITFTKNSTPVGTRMMQMKHGSTSTDPNLEALSVVLQMVTSPQHLFNEQQCVCAACDGCGCTCAACCV